MSPFIEKKLLGGLLPLLEKLVAFENTQAAIYLMRISYSSVRATHFMRTTPLSNWHSIAKNFDALLRKTFSFIVGLPLPSRAYTQMCLTPKLGGFGLRQVEAHADGAFNASRFEVFSAWGSRLGWSSSPSPAPSQQEASFTLDTNIFLSLVSSSSSPRERQRLNRLNQPHAGSWVTALPSSIDGPEAIIRPTAFRIACRLRLDRYGDHAICCTKTGYLIVRHNRISPSAPKPPNFGVKHIWV